MVLIFIRIFLYISTLLSRMALNVVRIWCSWCSIADFSSACTGSSPVIRYLNVYSSLSLGRMLGRIVLWLMIMVIGGGMIYYSANLVGIFGRSSWADEHLWWTRQLWVLIWFWLVVIGGLVMFWIVSFTNPADVDTTTFG